MTKKIKISLVVASLFFVIGSTLFIGALAAVMWDFTKLSAKKYTNKEYALTQEFSNITILTDTSDVNIIKTTEKSKVVLVQEENIEHKVEIKDGTLYIEQKDNRKWYEHIGLNFSSSEKITVYLPNDKYELLKITGDTSDVNLSKDITFNSVNVYVSTGDVECYSSIIENGKFRASTGDITIKNQSLGTLELEVSTGDIDLENLAVGGDVSISVSTGDVEISNLTCKNLKSKGSTGEIELESVIASEKITITRSTGSVEFNRSDASEIFVTTGTGDVKGSLLSDKIFIANTSTGDKYIPSSTSGGKCEINTSTGDIKITIIK